MDERRRDPERIETLLDGILARLGVGPEATLTVLRSRWPEATGPGWGGTSPVRFEGGVLVVEVPDGVTASRLQYDRTRVVARLNAVAAEAQVVDVRFRVARRHDVAGGRGAETQ